MASQLAPLVSGTLFGSALTASSVYLPSVILGQLSLTSTVMLKTFLTASACSAIIIYISRRLGYAKLPCRTNSSYGWVGSYDANIVGGLLQGVGMALTGACPGTVLVQVSLGIQPAQWTLLGSVLGGLAFTMLSERMQRKTRRDNVQEHTVMDRLRASDESAVLGYEALLIAVIATVDKLGLSKDSRRFWLNPVEGGLLIGVAQASSVLLSKKTLGVSSAYGELGMIFRNVISGKGPGGAVSNMVFAAGVMLGAQIASHNLPVTVEMGRSISHATAVFGGFCSIFGARLAGGCTSGHGLSGMATLSISSFVTVAGMFGGGIALRKVLDTV